MTAMEQTANHNTDTTQLVNKRVNRLLIILILISTGIFTYLRSHYREPNQDDLLYGYVLKSDSWGSYWGENILHEKISCFGDIVDSQIDHYYHLNGRSLVHAVAQLFIGIIGTEVYNVLGAIMMMALICMTVRYCLTGRQRGNPIWWLLTAIAIMYLMPYPHRLWYSTAYSCNYLISALLMMAVFMLFRHVNARPLKKYEIVMTVIVSFVFGWSHEAYSLPVAGGVFFYYIFHFDKFRKQGWILALPLFLGALIMLVAPANWARLDASEVSLSLLMKIAKCLQTLTWIPMTDVFAITLLMSGFIFKLKLRTYAHRHSMLLMSIIFGIGFLCYIEAYSYAYTPITFMFLLVTLELTGIMLRKVSHPVRSRTICCVLLAVFVVSQTSIANANRIQADYQRDMVGRFMASEDGLVVNNPPIPNWYDSPYVTIWPLSEKKSPGDIVLSAVYGKYKKKFTYLDPAAFSYVHDTEMNHIHVDGGTPFVPTREWFVAAEDSVAAGTEFEMEYHPVDFSHDTAPFLLRIKFAIVPPDYYPNRERVTPDTAVIGNRRFLYFPVPGIRRVKAIRAIKEPA